MNIDVSTQVAFLKRTRMCICRYFLRSYAEGLYFCLFNLHMEDIYII
jgi:hypothetical protein